MKNSSFKIKLLLTITLMIGAISSSAQPQFDPEAMRAKYEARKPHLDSMANYPTDFGMDYESFNCNTHDSISISGWFIPNVMETGTILMVHGFDMNKSHMLSRANFFHNQGYSILLIDLRARGESGGLKATTGKLNGQDVEATYNWYQDNYANQFGPITFYGYSHGGRAIIFGANETGSEANIILESTPYILANGFERQYHFPSPMSVQEIELNQALGQLKTKSLLLLIGDNDTAIIPEEADTLIEQLGTSCSSDLIIFENTKHAIYCDKNMTQYQSTIQLFLD